MIYLDNAATTMKKPQSVIDAVAAAMGHVGNAGRGAHEASLDAGRILWDTRIRLADLFHCKTPSQIAFTANATEALNIAIKGLLQPGDHVITTAIEHNSVLRPLYEMEERGVELTIIAADDRGRISIDDFEKNITDRTKAIICTHASNVTGNIMPIEEIGQIAKKHHLLFILDASQTAGSLSIDVKQMNIDVLCFTGHKSLLGPQGTGGIYVREGMQIRPLKTGGSGIQSYDKRHPAGMPTALEAGTLNIHGLAGLGAAISHIQETGIHSIHEKEMQLMWHFYNQAKEIKGIRIYGDFETGDRCPIVSLNVKQFDSSQISDMLYEEYGIATRAGAHCAPLMHKALQTMEQGTVRFSFSFFNTLEEVDCAINALKELAELDE